MQRSSCSFCLTAAELDHALQVSKLVGPKPLLPSPKNMFKGKGQAQNKAQEGEMERQVCPCMCQKHMPSHC